MNKFAGNNTLTIMTSVKMERIADLLCCAFEGGVGYWCTIVDYQDPSDCKLFADVHEMYKYIDYPLNIDGAVMVKAVEDDKIYTLDFPAILRGLKVMMEKYPRHFGDWLDDGEDAITGDVFVQCCLFDEVRYS